MDAGLLNFHRGEDFSNILLDLNFDDEAVVSNNLSWDWDTEHEHEINGDIALIPVANNVETITHIDPTIEGPPRDDFKLLGDWDVPQVDEWQQQLSTSFPEELLAPEGFDIAAYIEQPEEEEEKKPKLDVIAPTDELQRKPSRQRSLLPHEVSHQLSNDVSREVSHQLSNDVSCEVSHEVSHRLSHDVSLELSHQLPLDVFKPQLSHHESLQLSPALSPLFSISKSVTNLPVRALTKASSPKGILPTATLRKPTLHKPTLPKPTLPKATLPKPTLPKPTLPTASLRKPTLPKPTLPKPTLPKATLPKGTLPKATLPKPTLPKPILPVPTALRIPSPPPRLGGKRIDMQNQRYVLSETEDSDDSSDSSSESSSSSDEEDDEDEDKSDNKNVSNRVRDDSNANKLRRKHHEHDDEDAMVDVETVFDEDVNQPVLQAGNLASLLEQFEATESTNLELNLSVSVREEDVSISEKETIEAIEACKPPPFISPIKTPRKALRKKPENRKPALATRKQESKMKVENQRAGVRTKEETRSRKTNKQILDALPTDLIDRIKQSCKRKPPVQVIPPVVPAKRRHVAVAALPQKESCAGVVQLDHSYCSNAAPPAATPPSKDSGFSSAEEEEKSILRTQPTVKNADGKLMVSLLKTNTIKKKLNLEEYKQRYLGKPVKSKSGSNSCNEDDENTKRLKKTEEIMKQVAKSLEAKNEKVEEVKVEIEERPVELPPNLIQKVLFTVGTNTEESWGHLEEILSNPKVDLNPNSLISSIVEHLPKVKTVIKEVEAGEDKTILFLDVNAVKPKTASVGVQTINTSTGRGRKRVRTSSVSDSSSDSDRSRSSSPTYTRYVEQLKEVEERRVVYIGKLDEVVTRDALRRRFERFGPITNVSVHFRRKADNYGFVTYVNKEDAYEAVGHGNDDPHLPRYDLSFGGRRMFCKTTYADLDDVKEDPGYWSPIAGTVIRKEEPFEVLLRQVQSKLKHRKL